MEFQWKISEGRKKNGSKRRTDKVRYCQDKKEHGKRDDCHSPGRNAGRSRAPANKGKEGLCDRSDIPQFHCGMAEDIQGIFKAPHHLLFRAGHDKTIAVDFDGVIVQNAWPEIGAPRWEVIDTLKILKTDYGAKLILWTCRTGKELKEAEEFCKAVFLPLDAVNENLKSKIEKYGGDTRKISADIYLDDCAMKI